METKLNRTPLNFPKPYWGITAICFLLLLILTGFFACVRMPDSNISETNVLFFPPPPKTARIQYLGSISSSKDLPVPAQSFKDLVLGTDETRYPMAKPNNAVLAGTRLFVCDSVLNTVLTYDLVSGQSGFLKGDRGNGKIQQPNSLVVDETGRIYVADKLRGAILIYEPDEQFLAAWGRPGEVQPVAVAVGRERLYICDMQDHQLEIWSRRDGSLIEAIGKKGVNPGEFYYPTQITLDQHENVYITDTGNFRVQKLSSDGKPLQQFGSHGTSLGHFAWPKGLDVDGHNRLYVTDSRFSNVQIFDDQGQLLLFFGAPGPDAGNLDLPASLRVYPWPAIPWLQQRVASGFDPEYLIIVVSQKGAGLINFFAVARDPAA